MDRNNEAAMKSTIPAQWQQDHQRTVTGKAVLTRLINRSFGRFCPADGVVTIQR